MVPVLQTMVPVQQKSFVPVQQTMVPVQHNTLRVRVQIVGFGA